MANVKISEMEEASQVISDDYVPIVQQGLNKKTKLEKITDFMATKIIESGSNENGNYIKYADGTMICMKQTSFFVQCNSAWGALYESSKVSFGAII